MSRPLPAYPECVLLVLYQRRDNLVDCREVLVKTNEELGSAESMNRIKQAFGYAKGDRLVRMYCDWTPPQHLLRGDKRGRAVDYVDTTMDIDLRCRPLDAWGAYGSMQNLLHHRLFGGQLFVEFEKQRNYREHE